VTGSVAVYRALVGLGGSLAVAAACSSARVGGPDGQGPGLTFPARFAEGSEQDGGEERTLARADGGGARPRGSLPDPEALKLARQWEYEILYDRGKLSVKHVRERRFDKPVPTQRQMGRFAIELWIGHELVERVRFDFPLLGAEEPPTGRRPLKAPPSFADGATVSRIVLVPASPRATRAVLVDRATGSEQELPWPPDAPLGPPRASLPAWKRADAGAAPAADGGTDGNAH
jgi:hypothetical protein